MTIESCLTKSKNERFRYFSQSHIDYCEGNICAALLVDFFAQWHVRKLEKNQLIEGKVYQYHTLEELRKGLLCAFVTNTLRKAIHYLEAKGLIDVHKNPKIKGDRTKFYIFYPEKFNAWMKNRLLENENNPVLGEIANKLPIYEASSEETNSSKQIQHLNFEATITYDTGALFTSSSQCYTTQVLNLKEDLNSVTSILTVDETMGKEIINPDVNFDLSNLISALCKNDSSTLTNALCKNDKLRLSNLHDPLCKFDNTLYNKIYNKTQQEPTTTPHDFSKIADENKPPVGCVVFDNQKNIFLETAGSVPTLPPAITASPVAEKISLPAAKLCENQIEQCLTPAQVACVQQRVTDWSMRGKISNHNQIQAEIEFALLDKETLNRCHHSFPKKLSVISALIENNRWTTPAALQKQNKQSNPIHLKETNVVYLQNHQSQELRGIDARITLIEAELVGHSNQLEFFRNTPTFNATKIFIEQKIKLFEEERETLVAKRNEFIANGSNALTLSRVST